MPASKHTHFESDASIEHIPIKDIPIDFDVYQQWVLREHMLSYDNLWRYWQHTVLTLACSQPLREMIYRLFFCFFAENKKNSFHARFSDLLAAQLKEKMEISIGLILQLLEKDGEALIYRLICYINENGGWSLDHFNQLLSLLVQHYEKLDFAKLECCFLDKPNINDIIKEVIAVYQSSSRSNSSTSLSTRLQRFKQDKTVEYPLSAAVLDNCRAEYELIYQSLQQSQPTGCDVKTERLVRIFQALEIRYQLIPTETQLLTLLALIQKLPPQQKGLLAQVKTGEGKTLIIALLALWYVLDGHVVDIVTSSEALAKRDQKCFHQLFEAFHFKSAAIQKKSQDQRNDFQAQVVYGTNTAFEFAYLNEGLSPEESIRGHRKFDVVIVDEVDNLFIDAACQSARIAVPANTDYAWIFPALVKTIQAENSSAKNIYSQQLDLRRGANERGEGVNSRLGLGPTNDLDAERVCNKAENSSAKSILELRQALLKSLPEYSTIITTISDEKLLKWMASAYDACFNKIEGKHYLVQMMFKDGKEEHAITIVDYSQTGRPQEGSQWQDGLHQCLQAKHGCRVTPLTDTAAAITHHQFFSKYQIITGLTGTIGEHFEREEIETTYQVKTFDVPPHYATCFVQEQPQLITTDHYGSLLQEIQRLKPSHRPMLFLFETILETEAFSAYLQKKNIAHSLFNDKQRESEDYLIRKAGELDSILLATNNAGRGTDIVLSQDSLKAGGLHVVFTFYPLSLRVEQQGFGRAARKGQPGSGRMVLDITSLKLPEENLSSEQIFKYLQKNRQITQQKQVELRKQVRQQDGMLFSILERFFKDLREVSQVAQSEKSLGSYQRQSQMKINWARFFTQCSEKIRKAELSPSQLEERYTREVLPTNNLS